LCFSTGKVGDVPRGLSDETHCEEQFVDLIGLQFFSNGISMRFSWFSYLTPEIRLPSFDLKR
jgi:hypothetical protein